MSTKHLKQGLFETLVVAAILCLSSWSVDNIAFWAFAAAFLLFKTACATWVNAELLDARLSPGRSEADALLDTLQFPVSFVPMIIAGLDVGILHISPSMPQWLMFTGYSLLCVAFIISILSMMENDFFLPIVRLQLDRGHKAVTTGPYSIIRHPGNFAMILLLASTGFALGSWAAVVSYIPAIALAVRRTCLEDRFLAANLKNYTRYMEVTKYRLLPGVW